MSDKIIRVGIAGGGHNSFVGKVHLKALEQTGECAVVCGSFGSTRHSSFESGKKIGLPIKRVYGTYRDMFRREKTVAAKDRMQLTVILTPNTMHYPVAMSSIDARFPVFSEKPFTSNLDEALNLSRRVRDEKVLYGIMLPYAGYPMLAKAHQMVHTDCTLGNIRKVVVEYQLGWLAKRLETDGHKQASWRTDPRRSGPMGCAVDHTSHCFYLTEWLTGLAICELSADLRSSIAGRILDDDATVMARLENGARAVFVTSQIATGLKSGINIRIFGDKASLEWSQGTPDKLIFRDLNCNETIYSGGTPFNELEQPYTPAPFGYEQAYINAVTASYRSFFSYLRNPDVLPSNPVFATVQHGLRAVTFVETIQVNIAHHEDETQPDKWSKVVVPPVPTL
jgi:predicted dehydrogenase